ncbi:MAG: O-antigen translocase [Nitrospirota bacterium]
MNLIKTSFISAISTAVTILTGFVTNKIIAVYTGPAGLALLGQFSNFTSAVMAFSTGGINNGVIKYTAEFSGDDNRMLRILSTSFIIVVFCSFVVSAPIIIFRRHLSLYLLKSESYSSVFLIFGFTLILFALNSVLMSVLNGYKEIKKYVAVNIASSFVGLIFTGALVFYLGLYGAFLSFVTAQSVVFLITLGMVARSRWFEVKNFFQGYDKDSLVRLGKFALMTLVSAFTFPTVQIIIRNHIADRVSLEAAGYWQGVWRISEVYLMLITTSLSIYYLPRLSEIKETNILRKEIIHGYKILLPVVVVSALSVYFLREPIIRILFTGKFLPMSELFAFQLIGDFLKISSWLLSYLMIAKAMTKLFISTDIVFSLSFLGLSMLFINLYGVVGVTYAFALNYLLYLLVMSWIFRDVILANSEAVHRENTRA